MQCTVELHGALWSSVEHCGAPSRALKHWVVWSEFFLIGLCGSAYLIHVGGVGRLQRGEHQNGPGRWISCGGVRLWWESDGGPHQVRELTACVCGSTCMQDSWVMCVHPHNEFGGQIYCCNFWKGIFVSYACRTIFVAIFVWSADISPPTCKIYNDGYICMMHEPINHSISHPLMRASHWITYLCMYDERSHPCTLNHLCMYDIHHPCMYQCITYDSMYVPT